MHEQIPSGLCLSALAASLVVACSSPEPEVAIEGDFSALQIEAGRVEQVLRDLDEAFSNEDLASIRIHFSEDIVYLPPGEPAVIGLESVMARDSAYLADHDVELTSEVEEIALAGNQAFARYDYAESWTPKAGGPTRTVTGKGIAIFAREADESWRLIRWIWNTNESG